MYCIINKTEEIGNRRYNWEDRRAPCTQILTGKVGKGQSQKAVSAYFTSEQILPFGFAEQYRCLLE